MSMQARAGDYLAMRRPYLLTGRLLSVYVTHSAALLRRLAEL
jgi:hypothetical protein